MPQHVAPTHDPHRLERIVDDRQARERVLEEKLSRITYSRVGLECFRVTGHDLMRMPLQAVGISVRFGQGAEIGTQGTQQVAVRNHPAQSLVRTHYEQMVETRLIENLPNGAQWIIHVHRHYAAGHDFTDGRRKPRIDTIGHGRHLTASKSFLVPMPW